jgi:mono/diheme cytochrome c family protein
MKKVGNHNSISRSLLLSLALMLTFSLTSLAQNPDSKTPAPAMAAAPAAAAATTPAPATAGGDVAKGKELFNTNCAACHKLDDKATGPALRGVADRHSMAWIYKWVNNSAALIKAGDAEAVKVYEENNKVNMTAFPQLSTADIDNIIAYTSEKKAEPAAGAVSKLPGTEAQDSGISNNVILGFLVTIMLLLVVMLFLVYNMLTKVADAKGIEILKKDRSIAALCSAFAKNQFLVLVSSILLLLVSAFFFYTFVMQIGVDQEYSPVQPIHFSHRIHAGSNGINCKYCHSSARVSKNAGVPSLNVCMNCHKNISQVSDTTATPEHSKAFYDGEIQKLYKAVGWDGTLQKYTGKT